MSVIADDTIRIARVEKARGYWATVGRRLMRDKVAVVCAAILILIALAAILAPWLGLADPYQGSMIRRLRPIGTPRYILGTDELGRDMLARLIYGGRLSLFIGLTPVLLAFVIGTTLGVVAGYVGGLVNQAIMCSEELIRVAILWHEQWHEGLEEASRLYFGERNIKGMFETLEPLHQMLQRGPQTLKETSFNQAYGRDLNEAQEWCKHYKVGFGGEGS